MKVRHLPLATLSHLIFSTLAFFDLFPFWVTCVSRALPSAKVIGSYSMSPRPPKPPITIAHIEPEARASSSEGERNEVRSESATGTSEDRAAGVLLSVGGWRFSWWHSPEAVRDGDDFEQGIRMRAVEWVIDQFCVGSGGCLNQNWSDLETTVNGRMCATLGSLRLRGESTRSSGDEASSSQMQLEVFAGASEGVMRIRKGVRKTRRWGNLEPAGVWYCIGVADVKQKCTSAEGTVRNERRMGGKKVSRKEKVESTGASQDVQLRRKMVWVWERKRCRYTSGDASAGRGKVLVYKCGDVEGWRTPPMMTTRSFVKNMDKIGDSAGYERRTAVEGATLQTPDVYTSAG
ncbi:hypothetical protein C8R45DRAFT_936062 [Mycena sanguinolenta]|nr:hypothetical protein C8R45DRAFT_936062 [Mycena sanguinolenta]